MNKSRQNILITGATGFFGLRLLREILTHTKSGVFLLIRPKKNESPEAKLKERFREVFDSVNLRGIFKRITIVEGDIVKRNLGITVRRLGELSGAINLIYHSAALLDPYAPIRDIRRVNVEGTRNVLDFAYSCYRKGALDKVNHISTVYVIGTKGMGEATFYESQLDISQGFNNIYEQTKYEAEVVVEKFRRRGLDIDIYRPSIMVNSLPVKDPKAFALFFKPFKFLMSDMFKEIPAGDDIEYNIISVDDAARAVFLISKSVKEKNKNYHIVNPVGMKFGGVLDISQKVFGKNRPICVPFNYFDMDSLSATQKAMLKIFIPYFNFKAKFDASNAQKILKKKNFSYSHLKDDEIESIFKFAASRERRQNKGRYAVKR